MYAKKIDIDAIDEGLDRKLLIELKKRFLKVNQQRLERTRETLPYRQQVFIEMLPLLLHTNHPVLPGYTSHQCPAGIYNFQPSKTELKQASSFARSFRFNQHANQRPCIEALFLMGSGGTIAQSRSSDLDIWVCHVDNLAVNERKELDEKCKKLSQWATTLGLETHFYLMVASDFKAGKFVRFGKESSGSTQHVLLLDEFYRTALLLAGKMPLWWFVPVDCESNYEHFIEVLTSRRYLPAKDYIDFGAVSALPMGEFSSAAIWQLYKAIESPYKSVLKLLLLEVYAHQFPQVETLSLLFKRCIYYGELNIDRLDPYFLIYQRLENYLLENNQAQRLELVRRCFYFKVGKPLTKALTGAKKSWQRLLLESLVSQWHWSNDYLRLLDSRQRWKCDWVLPERKALVKELTRCYRYLMDFTRQEKSPLTIQPQEFVVLGRKLHANFERRAGKVEFINPGISDDLSETHLQFVEHYDEFLHATKWSMYPLRDQEPMGLNAIAASAQAQEKRFKQNAAELKSSRHLTELLVWSYFNELLGQNTRLEVNTVNSQASLRLLEQIVLALRQWASLPLPVVAHDTFKQSAYLVRALFLINVDADPFPELREAGMQKISAQGDVLNYGKEQDNLVKSIDLVSLNSWNEVEVHRFEGDALLRCLLFFFSHYPTSPSPGQPRPQISFYCATPGYGNSIRLRFQQLLDDLLRCFFPKNIALVTEESTAARQPRYVFQVAQRYYCLQMCDNQPKLMEAEDEEELQNVLAQKQTVFSPLTVDQAALRGSPLKLIAGVSDNSAIQLFYSPPTPSPVTAINAVNTADIYLRDEKGSLFRFAIPFVDEKTLLRPLHHFIRAAIDRQNIQAADSLGGFGVYPVEFFRLHYNTEVINTKVIHAGDARYSGRGLHHNEDDTRTYTHIERCQSGTELAQLPFFNVQVIAEPVEPNHLAFRIYCDDVEFSELQHGPRLFQEVARYILSLRRQRQRYPCYITDLDLSQCLPLIAPHGQLQISHYFEIKAPLERKINAALQALS